MVDLDWKSRKMATPEVSARSPKLQSSNDKSHLPIPFSPRVQDASATAAYEHYLRLPELTKLLSVKAFPSWEKESIIKPALQALEITFRFISLSLSDPRPYTNHSEWKRKLEFLAMHQLELIASICEDEKAGGSAPITKLGSPSGVLTRDRSSQEVWQVSGASPVVSRTSEASLLPRLATWEKSEDIASKILLNIECQMHRCPFTLGLGEPNLAGKPNLEYDLVVRPSDLHSLKKPSSPSSVRNIENDRLFTIHQILESWLFAARELLKRIGVRVDGKEWERAASDCWILHGIWKLLSEVEELHVLMDPNDFLRLKSQLAIQARPGSEALCFRSAALLDLTRSSKDLKRRVPWILGVEVDPKGGPRVQDAAMMLFHSHSRAPRDKDAVARLHLLQAFQAIEGAMKSFFFAYRQLMVTVMGSLEASGNVVVPSDTLAHMFLEPPYFPSLDSAKTFLGEFWWRQRGASPRSTLLDL